MKKIQPQLFELRMEIFLHEDDRDFIFGKVLIFSIRWKYYENNREIFVRRLFLVLALK